MLRVREMKATLRGEEREREDIRKGDQCVIYHWRPFATLFIQADFTRQPSEHKLLKCRCVPT